MEVIVRILANLKMLINSQGDAASLQLSCGHTGRYLWCLCSQLSVLWLFVMLLVLFKCEVEKCKQSTVKYGSNSHLCCEIYWGKNPPIPAYVCYTDIGQLINWSGSSSSCSYWLRRRSLGFILQMLASIFFWVDIENGLHRAEYLPGSKLMGE